jgi:aminoglycoside 3-N-acetyltransferase
MTPKIIPAMLADLRAIGVREGGCLVVHSSFKSLGLTDASPVDVIRTLIEAVGDGGTLMMPTFTYCYAGICDIGPYNPQTTASRFMGILPEALRRHPGALRSGSPTYSVAAFGRHARLLTEGKENVGGLGRGSSFEDAYRLGAQILLIGVGNNRNSMIHYAECASGLPICDIPYREFWGRTALVEKDGRVVEVALNLDFPGCSANFGLVDEYLVEKGLMKRGKMCSAACLMMNARQIVDAIAARLRAQPDWLFCDSLTCEPCHLRRKRLRERGLI